MLRIARVTLILAVSCIQSFAADLTVESEWPITIHPLLADHGYHDTDHFRVAHRDDALKARLVGDLLEQCYGQVHAMLSSISPGRLPSMGPMNWVCFADRTRFEQYAMTRDNADVRNLNGYFSTRTNEAVLYWGDSQRLSSERAVPSADRESAEEEALLGTMTSGPVFSIIVHESVHQIAYNSGLQVSGRRYPLWFTEGLAMSLEDSMGSEREQKHGWAPVLGQMHRASHLLSLTDFVLISDVSYVDRDRVRRLYAQAWGVFHFLLESDPQGLRHYIDGLGARGVGEALALSDFEIAFGPMDGVEREWSVWLSRIAR